MNGNVDVNSLEKLGTCSQPPTAYIHFRETSFCLLICIITQDGKRKMLSDRLTARASSIVAAHVIALIIWTLPPVLTQATIDPTASVNATLDSGMDPSLRKLLIDMHNEYRREETTAANMNKLDWSPYLEQEAAKWVARCEFKHQDKPSWGENLYRSTFKTSPDNTISNGLMAWQLEKYNIQTATGGIDCCNGSKLTCCHYTQMVWAASEYVGCAIKQCAYLEGPGDVIDYTDAWFLACYYYPPGNVVKQQPYLTGADQCIACLPTNPDCDKGLCYFDVSRC
ncbi:hypothetical protein BsWGS_20069 [Bradybaena similaris]